MNPKNKVLVIIEGGICQFVYSDDPNIQVIILDHDNYECVREIGINTYEHDPHCDYHSKQEVNEYITNCLLTETLHRAY